MGKEMNYRRSSRCTARVNEPAGSGKRVRSNALVQMDRGDREIWVVEVRDSTNFGLRDEP
jgi:hypothetical protein